MNFETLPNEIFLDLFNYFNGVNLLHAFYGLNSRFNLLLYKQYRSYRFQFNSISDYNFDTIFKQHLPFIADRIITLRLSNVVETNKQIDLFLSYTPSFNRFTHLKSFTLWKLDSAQTWLILLDQFHHLNSLTSLTFSFCSFPNGKANFQLIVDKIWSLSNLIYYYGDIYIENQKIFCLPTVISASLQYLTISHSHELQWNQLNRLFHYTPRLKYLSATFECSITNDYIAFPLPLLTKLKLSIHKKPSELNTLLQNVPNLRHLNIKIWLALIDGHQWKEIILNYLPKLKTFRLQMIHFVSNENAKVQAERLIDSFRNSFWIDERRWFVRCDVTNYSIRLQTLPRSFRDWNITFSDLLYSTIPQKYQQKYYDNLTYIYDEKFFDQPIPSYIHMPNIEYLYIKLPINDQFWSIIPNLNRLCGLTIVSYVDTFHSQVQTLLDRAPHLKLLIINQYTSLPFQMSLFKCSNASIHELYLDKCEHYFNEEECISLSSSSLGVQCEVLAIRVDNRECIINLVKNMFNLRVLIINWTDEKYSKDFKLTNTNDEYSNRTTQISNQFSQWLEYHLPSTYVVISYSQHQHDIFIRIERIKER